MALASSTAFAQNPQARARGLNRDAMEEDYLATNMRAALAKLQTALRVCGKDKCSKDLVAKIYANLGIVYAAGMNQNEDAIEAFKQALSFDPNVTPDANYLTGTVQKAFDAAKAAGGGAQQPAVAERTVGALSEKPWPEQATWNPVPVYVELPETVEGARVVVRYKGPAQREWKELNLEAHGKGFGGYIPCPAVEREGDLLYFVTAFDANLDRIANGGSAAEPRKVHLKKAIDGRQPSLPDTEPPTACPRRVEGLSCETNHDCPSNQECSNQKCVDKTGASQGKAGKLKKNWVGIGFSPDLMLVDSTKEVCSPGAQDNGHYGCFWGNDQQYLNELVSNGGITEDPGELNGGFGFGSMRALLSYDRVLGTRMTVGARLGFAFFGYPGTRKDGKDFFPFHAEARFAFFFTKDPFASKGIRPYAFAGGGLAEATARVSTKVRFDDPTSATGQTIKTLDAYQTGGIFFGGLGGGVQYALNPALAIVGEVGIRVYLPLFAFGVSPMLGIAYGF